MIYLVKWGIFTCHVWERVLTLLTHSISKNSQVSQIHQESFGRVVGCIPSGAHHSTAPARPWGRRIAALSPPGCSLGQRIAATILVCIANYRHSIPLYPYYIPISYYIILYHTISYYIILYHTISYYIILYHTMLNTISYYILTKVR
jgi:hypothetical protein